jgi:DNA-directed RNA polymerase subunit beta'
MKLTKEIFDLEKSLRKLENLHASFDYIKITLASPRRIRTWAERILPSGELIGEVKKPETINFRTHQPEPGGLFCEKIFGPIKDYTCRCGKYKGFILEGVCDICHVELVEARVRRYRMGYIELVFPVAHIWYLRGVPNYLSILLRCVLGIIKPIHLEKIVYHKTVNPFKTIDPFQRFAYQSSKLGNELKSMLVSDLIDEVENEHKRELVGAELLKAALESIDVEEEIQNARSLMRELDIHRMNGTKDLPDKSLIRRIRILESFFSTQTNPSRMILTTLPVLPPNLRPLVELENGLLVAADTNEIYRIILNRNQRLFDFMYSFQVPNHVLVNERKLLQEGVDALIDNARLPKQRQLNLNDRPFKSLTEILEGKQGRFRQSLLGKRVDYSGRSVIIVGPSLRLNQCGLPFEMGTELFFPFLVNALLKTKLKGPSHNTKLAQIIIKKNKPFVWNLLVDLVKKYPVLLNRAPTLHRFGVQAFDPVVILGQAIHLHPLVCTGFNADFDGDQMAIHLPLYASTQLEARTMMRPSLNVLSPANGEVILKPSQDMVIGCYYLTAMIHGEKKNELKKWFGNEDQALCAYYQKHIQLQSPILVRYKMTDFQVEVKNKQLKLLPTKNFLPFMEKEIRILKIFENNQISKAWDPQETKNFGKVYFLTNLGIFIGESIQPEKYSIHEFFLETTPGRLIFSINFKNCLKKENHAY